MAIDEPKLTNEQLFMKWLSTQMPNGRVPDLHQVFAEVESFCKKLHILKQPLFDTFDYETIAKVRKTVEQNKIFTITHRKQMVLVRSGIHYYSIYIREGHYKSLAASQPRDAVQSAIDDALDSQLSQVQETSTSASSVERTPKHNPSDHVITDPILPKEEQMPSNQEAQSLSPEELVRKALKEETEKNNYGTTITFLNGVLHIPSQSIKAILDKAEWALYRYGRYFYVEPPESDNQRDSEQPVSFSSGVAGDLSDMSASSAVDDGPSSVLPVDSLLAILTEKEISFIDMRGKGGKLWIIGDKSLQGATEELQKQGYSFRFCSGGSKSTDWRSSWYLDEEANIHMSASKETMQESPIGDRALSPELLQAFMESHPEYCDDFLG